MNSTRPRNRKLNRRRAECHPNRAHLARGLCRACYSAIQQHDNRASGGRCVRCCQPRGDSTSKIYCSDCLVIQRERQWLRRGIRSRDGRPFTEADYMALLQAQRSRCAISGCRRSASRLDVDHDHTTGKVRGLLCNVHNQQIGQCQQSGRAMSPEILAYLAQAAEWAAGLASAISDSAESGHHEPSAGPQLPGSASSVQSW
jgi:hypothetical protein